MAVRRGPLKEPPVLLLECWPDARTNLGWAVNSLTRLRRLEMLDTDLGSASVNRLPSSVPVESLKVIYAIILDRSTHQRRWRPQRAQVYVIWAA